MQTVPLQLSDVIYNAATQSFEALVIVHDAQTVRSYACAIAAPITMEFADAASGLATQALRRHTRGRPDSVHASLPATPRATRRTDWRRFILAPLASRTPRAA